MNTLASWAEDLTRTLLQKPLPRRWAHVQGVAARARSLAPVLGDDADLLEAAAWLHDIGYAPDLAVTGLHALDGARYLRDAQHADAMLCRLVAHHSCAIIEAGERGLADVLSLEFERAPHTLASVLTYCDMTTSPDGKLVLVDRRLAEIQQRYGQGHLVSRSIQRATPMILRAVQEVQDRAARSAQLCTLEQGRCPDDLDLGWNRVHLAPGMTLLVYYAAEWVGGLDTWRDQGHRPRCGRSVSLFLFPAAESGHHVDAAASVAGGAGRYRQGGETGVPEGVAGDAGPG